MLTPILETERLVLRRFHENDAQEVFGCWMNDHEVARYMMWESCDDVEPVKEFIAYELSMLKSDKWYRWCIQEKQTGLIIGTCLIYFNEEENCWDISYNLGRKYWGKGYTTEAMKAAMNFAIHTVGASEFASSHAVENPASGKVMEKLGFQFEKETEYVCNEGKCKTRGKKYRLAVRK